MEDMVKLFLLKQYGHVVEHLTSIFKLIKETTRECSGTNLNELLNKSERTIETFAYF